MARKTITLTSSWQLLTTGAAGFEIKRESEGELWVNNAATEIAASKRSSAELQPTDQIFQTTDGEETWMKGEGWEIIVDAENIEF